MNKKLDHLHTADMCSLLVQAWIKGFHGWEEKQAAAVSCKVPVASVVLSS